MLDKIPLKPYMSELYSLTATLEQQESKRHKVVELMEKAPCICFIKNGETGKFEYINKAFCTMLSTVEEDVLGKTALDLFDFDVATRMVEYDLRVLKDRSPVILLTRVVNKLYVLTKFLVVNGGESIGGFGLELPDTFILELQQGDLSCLAMPINPITDTNRATEKKEQELETRTKIRGRNTGG